jgi:hypothetical protein
MTVSMEEFGKEMERVNSDIRQTVSLFYTFISMHNAAAKDRKVFNLFNKDAEFWSLQLYALQQSMIICLGRVFDNVPGSFGINMLLSEAVKHPEFFSKDAFRIRRMAGLSEVPDYLDEYVAAVYEPTVADLGRIHASLSSHRDVYTAAYGKIRSLVVAHSIVRNQSQIDAFFGKTVIADAMEMFKALMNVMQAIYYDLWLDGRKPSLGSHTFTEPEKIESMTLAALQRLVY